MADRLTTPQPEEIERRLLDFIRSELLGTEAELGREDELLTGELIDSLGVVRLGTFVSEEFQLEMKSSDFVVENFRTVAVLSRYVQAAMSSRD